MSILNGNCDGFGGGWPKCRCPECELEMLRGIVALIEEWAEADDAYERENQAFRRSLNGYDCETATTTERRAKMRERDAVQAVAGRVATARAALRRVVRRP